MGEGFLLPSGGEPQFTVNWGNYYNNAPALKYLSQIKYQPGEEAMLYQQSPAQQSWESWVAYSRGWMTRRTQTSRYAAPGEADKQLWAGKNQTLRVGSAEVNALSWDDTMDQFFGQFIGQVDPVFGQGEQGPGQGGDPFSWAAERGIGFENLPSRALDYLAVGPALAFQHYVLGQSVQPFSPDTDGPKVQYAFQAEPEYWQTIKGRSDEQLKQAALAAAAVYSAYPEQFAEELYRVFKLDHDLINGALSSGNERTDYIAKKYLEWVMDLGKYMGGNWGAKGDDEIQRLINGGGQLVSIAGGAALMTERGLITLLPSIGTPLASWIDPVHPATENAWQKLSPDSRVALYGSAGLFQAGNDFIVMWPLFQGAGAFANLLSKGGSGAGWATSGLSIPGTSAGVRMANLSRESVYLLGQNAPWLYKGYTTVLHATEVGLGLGLTTMAANWALENWLPGYYDAVGKQIDMSRPISGSDVAMAVNLTGWLTTTGLITTTRAANAALHGRFGIAMPKKFSVHPLGEAENRLYGWTLGGAAMDSVRRKLATMADGSPLSPTTFEAAYQGVVQSRLARYVRDNYENEALSILAGTHFLTREVADFAERAGIAQRWLTETAEPLVRSTLDRYAQMLVMAKQHPSVWQVLKMSDRTRREQAMIAKAARTVEDEMARTFSREYGPGWWERTLAHQNLSYGRNGLADYVERVATRNGMVFDKKAAVAELGDDMHAWEQFALGWHQLDYHAAESKLEAALAARPDLGLSAHPADYFVMRANHLFDDQADYLLAAIDQMGKADELLPEEEIRSLFATYAGSLEEVDRWWAANGKGANPHDVDLAKVKEWLESQKDIFPGRHRWRSATPETMGLPINTLAREVEDQGSFVLAYKPKGRLVGYVPVTKGFANRISKNLPDNYTFEATESGWPINSIEVPPDAYEPGYAYTLLNPTTLEHVARNQLPASRLEQQLVNTDWGRPGDRLPASAQPVGRVADHHMHWDRWLDPATGQEREAGTLSAAWGGDIMDDLEVYVQTGTGLEWVPFRDVNMIGDPDLIGRQLFHASPVKGKVMADGLKSRWDVMKAEWDRTYDGVTLREALSTPTAAADLRVTFHFAGQNYVWFTQPGYQLENVARNYSRLSVGQMHGTITPNLGGGGPSMNMGYLTPGMILKIEGDVRVGRGKRATYTTKTLWQRDGSTPGNGVGLSDSTEGQRVSVTWSEAHAQTIVERLRMGIEAARADIAPNELFDYWAPVFNDLDGSRLRMVREGCIDAQVIDRGKANDIENKHIDQYGVLDEDAAAQEIEDTVAAMIESDGRAWTGLSYREPSRGNMLYVLHRELDNQVLAKARREGLSPDDLGEEFSWVGLGAEPDAMRLLDPADVGYFQVARRNGAKPSDKVEAELELKFQSNELWTVDPAASVEHAGARSLEPEPWMNWQGGDASQIRLVDIEGMRPLFAPAAVDPARVDAMAAEISANGMAEPVVIEFYKRSDALMLSRDSVDALAAADRLGWREVPTVMVVRNGAAPPGPMDPFTWIRGGFGNRTRADRPIAGHWYSPDQFGYRSRSERRPRWSEPWTGTSHDPKDGALPEHEYVSYLPYQDKATGDSTLLKAGWNEYPLHAGAVRLGNRTWMGRQMDKVFEGYRTWRITDHQVSQAHRMLAGTYEGLTPAQIDEFIARVYRLSHEQWAPFRKRAKWTKITGNMQVPLSPQGVAILRSEDVDAIAKTVFGKDPLRNKITGADEIPDYPEILVNAFRQAYSLNLSAGVVSRMKTVKVGGLGDAGVLVSDWLIPWLRYKASVIFRSSELVESYGFNRLQGAKPSPAELAALRRSGVMPTSDQALMEQAFDPMSMGLMASPLEAGGPRNEMAGIPGLDRVGTGGPFAIEYGVRDLIQKGPLRPKLARLWDDVKNPTPYKEAKQYTLAMSMLDDYLPALIRQHDPGAWQVLTKELKVPENKIGDFLAEDRILYQRWQLGQIGMDDLIEHSAKYNPALRDAPELEYRLNRLYQSEDWKALDGLARLGAITAQSEAFGVHFFGSYRTYLERSVNHPLIGIYPASWAYKALKQWGLFLYDNRAFGQGQLRLGMVPAVAMRQVIQQINVAVAQNTDVAWESWLEDGPAANWFFIANLLMPGDWSSIPFPMSRTIRETSRAFASGDLGKIVALPVDLVGLNLLGPNNRGGIGAIRDANLFLRGLDDIYTALREGEDEFDMARWQRLTAPGTRAAPEGWEYLVNYPTGDFPVGD